ncbi:arsenate reductase (glutaredoxin) [Thermomonas paludicola]|uniref:arsenate reductase (glutaredoxin) n=1 Tax=Thermomonas paludicola TaxID=2884874 RepID=UPI0021151783|nr:arsenate reductase (glutaredoxin) [Thermomonas paludicola]
MDNAGQHVEIWHRPTCGNSRGALELIRAAGIEPVIVDYVNHPPSKARLRQAIADAGLRVREAIRSKEPEYAALGLDDPALSDDALLDALVATPLLINRPFVFTARGVRLCRPPEQVLGLL